VTTAPPPTSGDDYAERLVTLSSARWKQLLDVQRPYRWNIARLNLGRALEVGCGVGRVLAALGDTSVGIDHNARSIDITRERGLTAWTTDEWATCPDAVESSFDSLVLAHVLEHVDAPTGTQLINDYLPYLRPSAQLLLICPQERGYTSDATHVRFLDRADLEATVRTAGFTPTRSWSFPLPRSAGRAFTYNETVVLAAR
jgi:2-polyprenyl-3-methyl-5-hydroxy-6-metoxy-1,4-benzoquinol methylase